MARKATPARKLATRKRHHQHQEAEIAQRPVRCDHRIKQGWFERVAIVRRHGGDLYRKSWRKKSARKKVSGSAKPSVQKALAKAKKGSAAKVKSAPKRQQADLKASHGVSKPMTAAQSRRLPPLGGRQSRADHGIDLLPTRSRCWSRWCCRRRRPMPGSTRRRRLCFALADTPAKMAALGEDRIRDLIKTIGLFRTKAKNVAMLAHILVSQHGGQVPRTREALESVTGRRPQDGECRAQYRVRRTHHRRRYAYLSRRQPHRHGTGKTVI